MVYLAAFFGSSTDLTDEPKKGIQNFNPKESDALPKERQILWGGGAEVFLEETFGLYC